VFPTPAPPHGEVPNDTSYTTPHSLTRWPAATIRCGTSADGLPIGVQVIAHPWRDDVALAAASALEAALGGYAVPA
jgi:amidase